MPADIILGGGVTGLAAGIATGFPVFEAEAVPGGICRSYYIRPGQQERLWEAPEDGEGYRFEIGGGHWIFGGEEEILTFISSIAPLEYFERKSAVYFPKQKRYVPYPIQHHLSYFDAEIARKALAEMRMAPGGGQTMDVWLERHFGPTLHHLFFEPFHDLYTAGLFREILPQDAHKSPVNMALVEEGFLGRSSQAGYNVRFGYPQKGLDRLASGLANRCDLRTSKRVVSLDIHKKVIGFSDGERLNYGRIWSTMPLVRLLDLCGFDRICPDPYTSVLVLNIGARKGPSCPEEHWIYVPNSRSGFHRVGFYSNVTNSFLPKSVRENQTHVGVYVEKSYLNGQNPSQDQRRNFADQALHELSEWGMIKDVEAVDLNWVEVAYTWSFPGSRWKEEAIHRLQSCGINPIGRYGRWKFQGIAESIREGFAVADLLKRA